VTPSELGTPPAKSGPDQSTEQNSKCIHDTMYTIHRLMSVAYCRVSVVTCHTCTTLSWYLLLIQWHSTTVLPRLNQICLNLTLVLGPLQSAVGVLKFFVRLTGMQSGLYVLPMFFSSFLFLACLANLPEGLYILLALIFFLIFFNDHSEKNYLRIYWTDFRNFFHRMKAFWVQVIDLDLFFSYLHGRCHGNQFCVKMANSPHSKWNGISLPQCAH